MRLEGAARSYIEVLGVVHQLPDGAIALLGLTSDRLFATQVHEDGPWRDSWK